MVSLGQKLKMPKTCEKPFYKNIKVVLCKKTARKDTKYSRNEASLKIGHLAKAIAHAKAIAFAKWSVWVKNQKCQKHANNHSKRILKLFCAKNRSRKHQVFEKWDKFENRPSCKGYSPCKGYSLCKMVSLGQKLKMLKTCKKPFYKNIKIVLFTKPVEKNTKYSRNETSLKIGHLAEAIAHTKAIAFAKWSVWVKN